MFWNDWFLPLLYLNDRSLFPLQYVLYQIMRDVQSIADSYMVGANEDFSRMPNETIRMAICIIAAGMHGLPIKRLATKKLRIDVRMRPFEESRSVVSCFIR